LLKQGGFFVQRWQLVAKSEERIPAG